MISGIIGFENCKKFTLIYDANVSHDLRTPLTMIKGYSEVMRDLPGENTPENVQIIIDEAQAADRPGQRPAGPLQAGGRRAAPGEDPLQPDGKHTAAFCTGTTSWRITISPSSTGRRLWVDADELKISQVVYNLVNNAITYSGEDKTITLRQEL